ncbi:unnamed protein product [Lupinus luteus]|uniref:ABC transporter domain-containing protein n=1 Tax=Lupinus luteus TaxID=3873 RepID=A0AAV1WYJ8_LUPLU
MIRPTHSDRSTQAIQSQHMIRSLRVVLPDLKYFTEASVASSRIFDIINRTPLIDGEETKGLMLEKISGKLDFEHVKFTYPSPSRADMVVLKDFNLQVEAGKTVALVGARGSGKSTAIALVQRFYDADEEISPLLFPVLYFTHKLMILEATTSREASYLSS